MTTPRRKRGGQCVGTTTKGKPCGRPAHGSSWCHWHAPAGDTETAARPRTPKTDKEGALVLSSLSDVDRARVLDVGDNCARIMKGLAMLRVERALNALAEDPETLDACDRIVALEGNAIRMYEASEAQSAAAKAKAGLDNSLAEQVAKGDAMLAGLLAGGRVAARARLDVMGDGNLDERAKARLR